MSKLNEPRCAVCLDTGSKSQDIDGFLDCTSCDATERRLEMQNYISGLSPNMSNWAKCWAAYNFGMQRPVAAQGVAEGVLRDGVEDDAIGTLSRGDDSILFESLYDFHVTDGMKVYAAPVIAPTAAEKNKMYRRRMDALPIAAPTAVVAVPSWQLVPKQPTPEMVNTLAEGNYSISITDAYVEMLKIAPQPAAAPSGDVGNTATKD